MSSLIIRVNGMALIGTSGDRSECWFVDADRVGAGNFEQGHVLIVGPDTIDLRGGILVWFESEQVRLRGQLHLAQAREHLVDFNALSSSVPILRSELLDDAPVAGGAWNDVLSAWVRLPGGTIQAHDDGEENWRFRKDPRRSVTDTITIIRDQVIAPEVFVQYPGQSVNRIPVPFDRNGFVVTVSSSLFGPPTSLDVRRQEQTRDEVGLLCACFTSGAIDLPRVTQMRPSELTDTVSLPILPLGCVDF